MIDYDQALEKQDPTARRRALMKIMGDFRKEGKLANRSTLQKPLEQAGFPASTGTIYRDITLINRENTWVKDLVESNYSAFQEHISDMLDFVEQEALDNYNKKWTLDKKTKRVVSNSKGEFESLEETTTQEMAAPKVQFLEIIGKVQQLRMKHTHGDNINISAALLSAELQDAKDKLQSQTSNKETPIVNVLELAKRVKQDGNH